MKSSTFIALFALLCITGTLGGRITAWGDIEVYNPNKGYVSYMDLYLTLDTKLPAGHLLRITLPFSIAPAISAVTVYSGAGSKGAFFATPASPNATSATTASTFYRGSSSPFNTHVVFGADLQPLTNYVLRVTIGSNITDVGFLGYVQLETMSPATSIIGSGSDLPISYDLNNAFAPVHIFAAPGALTLTSTADNNAATAGASSARQFKITPSQSFYYWPTIVLTWTNSNFTVTNLTSIDIGTNASAVTPLTMTTSATAAGQYSYTTSGTNLVIFHNALLTANTVVTYNVTVANPSTTASTSFTAMIYHRYNYNLTDVTGTAVSVSVTSSTTVTSTTVAIVNQQILLSWGIDRNSSTITGSAALQKVFVVYATPSTNPQYQAINFLFGLNGTLSSSSLYKVSVGVCAAIANCDVLENSIYSNITGASCSLTYGTGLSVYCNVSSLATSGNSIAARIWMAGTSGGGQTVLGTQAAGYSMNDTTFGTISITYLVSTTTNGVTTTTTTNAVSASGQASSPYMSTTFHYQPLININGNGPLVALPVSGTPPSPATAARTYDQLWGTSGGATTYSSVVSDKATNTYTVWPTSFPVSTIATGSVMGGIYASTTAGLKYNVGLFTNAIMFASSATTFSTFSAAAGAGYDASAPKITGVPGIDLFLNPNVFASAGSTTNQITQCYANNVAVRYPTNFYTGATDAAGATSQAHCFTNLVSGQYLRLRFMFTSKANTGVAKTATGTFAAGIESASTTAYMSFFWESALIITNAYAGSSVRADSNVPDFYGIFYTLVFTSSPAGQPNVTGPTTSATASDIGEISAITGLTSTALGMPIFWNQMLMGPYGSYASAAKAAYYAEKSVFISNYDINSAEATYTSNYAVNYLRVRGFFSTSGNDAGLVPTGGRLALFLSIPASETQFEGLGAIGFTTGSTANTYQTASTTVGTSMGTVPLVGNGAVRCWSNTGLGNCLLDRRGRPQIAIATGFLSQIDFYQIITADPTYSSNFSLVILIKPRITTALNTFKYRLGFQASNLFYIQSWDQVFDNGATVAANGSVTAIATPFTAPTIAGVPGTTVTGATCVLPYAASSNAAPGVRLIPGATETDNTLLSSTTTLGVNAAAAITATLKQGATTWCVQWNFKASSSFAITSNAVFESTTMGDKCQAFDYLSENATTYYCIYCPIAGTGPIPAQASATSPATLSLSSFTTGTAVNILQFSFASIAYDNGALTDVSFCSVINGPGSTANSTNPNVWLTNLITGVSSSGSAYNLTGQKVTFSFTAPSSLAYTIVDSITITGRNASTNSSDSNFPYGSLDTAAVCRIVPTASVTNTSAMFGCTAGISGGVVTITPTASAITSNYSTTTAWTVIIWGLNGNLSTSTSVTSTNFYVQTLKSSVLVDSSNTTNTSLAAYTLNTAAVLNFTTANVGYQRQIINARGYFRFDFAFTSRNWFSGDKLVFNLDGIITTTANNNTSIVKCRITDTSDNIQQIFQSCTLVSSTTPPTLTIYALPTSVASGAFDFTAANGYRVYLENMVTLTPQTVKVIWGNVYFNNGSTAALTKVNTGTDIAAQNLTTAQTMSAPVITKYFAAANDYQDLVFLFTTAQAFTSAGRITIAFPSYYNPGLTSRSGGAYCTVNGVYTMCTTGSNVSSASVVGIRTLALYGYSGSVAAGGSLVVKIGGIRAPPASYTLEQFYVQINIDNSEALVNISSAVAFNDTTYSAQTVVPLNVNWFTIGSTITRSTTTVTWTFGLNSTTTVSTTQAISAYFPEDWGLAWGFFLPTCTVIDATNASITYASAQSIFGNLVQLNVSTAIPNAAVVTLSCQNVRTPEVDGSYLGNQDITIRVHEANGSTVYQRSAPGMHNVNFAYAFKASLAYLSWNVSSTLASPASLTAGTYGLPLLLSVTTGASSNRTFTIVPSNANFGFISTAAPFYLTTGAVSNSSYLGCSSAVPVGVYGLTFTISDTTYYTTTPRLWVSVNNNAQPIVQSTTTMTTYYISGSTTSFAPLVFDTTAIPPYSDIVITPVAPTGNTNFTFTPAKITLTAGSPKNYFTFTTTSAVTAATASAIFTFTVTGTNAASYITPSAVTLGLTADTTSSNTGSPTLTVAADSTDTSAATSKILTLTLSGVTQATIYWAVTLQGQSITDATAIQSAAAALTQYNANSANQAQYGTFYQYASPSKVPSNFVVSGLYPATGYTITVIAVSLANKTSTVASFTFVTGANAASIQRWLFNYTTYPTQAQRQTLLCTITQQLAVPAVSVRDVNGEICGNTTSFYTTSNSTGDLGVYFYPLQVATDTVMPNLATNFNTTAKMNTLNTTISSGTGGLGFVNVVADVTVKNVAPSPTFPTGATVGQTWANIGGISLNDTGFVFIALGSNSTAAPTAVAYKQAAAGILSTTGLTNIQVLYYYPGGGSLSYNFTNLTAATSYNAYLLASNNDPSFLQNFTSVTTVTFTTASTGNTTGSPIGVMFSVMAIFASVISLLFL